jgi:hypothetical protein
MYLFYFKVKNYQKITPFSVKNVVMYFLAFFLFLVSICKFAANLKGHEYIGSDIRERKH